MRHDAHTPVTVTPSRHAIATRQATRFSDYWTLRTLWEFQDQRRLKTDPPWLPAPSITTGGTGKVPLKKPLGRSTLPLVGA